MKTIQDRRTWHAEYCWRSRDELIIDVLLRTPSHGRAKAGRPAGTYIQHLSISIGYNLEDLPGAMDDRDGKWEKVREIRAGRVTWWWSWWYYIVWYCLWPWVLRNRRTEWNLKKKINMVNFCSKNGVYFCVCLSLCVIEWQYACVCAVSRTYLCLCMYWHASLHIYIYFCSVRWWEAVGQKERMLEEFVSGGRKCIVAIRFSFPF